MCSMKCFKTYDIRGKINDEIDNNIAYKIGRAYGELFSPKTVVVGHDVRLTSESLKLSLSQGLLDSGVDVFDIGLSGTEEIYYATFSLELDGGIEITASHNPIEYNGMKLVGPKSRPISRDNGLAEIELLVEENNFSKPVEQKRGCYKKINILDRYISHLLSYIELVQMKPMKLVINSGNGAAGHVIDAIEKVFNQKMVPIEIFKINNEPDGNFPHGIPNPLLPECRSETANAVINHNADIGIAFDGDFDRCFFFDNKGNFIEGYYIVGLIAKSFLLKNKKERIIHDPRLTWNTIDIVNKYGGIPVQSKTGHAFIKEHMRQEDAIYGGEMSAHHYFRDFSYCDSGMIPWLLVAELVSNSGLPLSQLVSDMIAAYPSSGEINIIIKEPYIAIAKVEGFYRDKALFIDKLDGLSVEFHSWRFNLRVSNTESLLRLNVESKMDVDLMQEKTKEVLGILHSS
ncbi:phosphomannomutase CpsG [[Erwinia] mediterraneensis]|uniref:phosphomannomutase CpsG n=1 Tax=[Erwinia] mediterraneensis TaxID=2161819 RepID=UPI00103149B1|nr:phosphomannomutase CpsG [[Erwinia] mediterraneensis]